MIASLVRRLGSPGTSVLLATMLATGFAVSLESYWSPGDDHLNFFLTGRAIEHWDDINEALAQTIATLRELEFAEKGIASIEVRQKNLLNYLLPSLAYAAAAELVELLSSGRLQDSYPGYLVHASQLGYLLSFFLAAALFLAALRACPRRLRAQATAALAVILLCMIALPDSGYFSLGQGFLARLPLAIANPGPVHGALGITPRNNFVLLALAVFCLRLVGRYGRAYALLLVAMLFHRQQGAVLLVILLAVDLVMRPRLLTEVRVVPWTVLALGYFAATETLWAQMGIPRVAGLALVGGFALLAIVLALHAGAEGRAAVPASTVVSTLKRIALVVRDDRLLILMAWLGITIVSVVATAAGLAGAYFWHILPARLLIILQPLLVLSLIQAAWRPLPHKAAGAAWNGAARGLAALGLVAALIVSLSGALERLQEAALDIARAGVEMGLGLTAAVGYQDEERLYHAVVRSVDTESPHLSRLLAATRAPQPESLMAAIARDDAGLFARALDAVEAIDRPYPVPTPAKWPRPVIEVTPLVGALIWERQAMAKELTDRLEEPPLAPSLATFCDAILRGSNQLLLSLSRMMDPRSLDRSCPAIAGSPPTPPICLLRWRGEAGAAGRLAELGAADPPLGGC